MTLKYERDRIPNVKGMSISFWPSPFGLKADGTRISVLDRVVKDNVTPVRNPPGVVAAAR
jgi:hypothetical protein